MLPFDEEAKHSFLLYDDKGKILSDINNPDRQKMIAFANNHNDKNENCHMKVYNNFVECFVCSTHAHLAVNPLRLIQHNNDHSYIKEIEL